MNVFDFYGPVFIGVFVFFFVFITAGISFVRERTGGTLERVMATPIRRWELVLGYVQGFGAFSLSQTFIVAWASIYWVGFTNLGSFWLVLLIAESMALVSLALGILVSAYASTELQVIQLLQIIVIPQIILSGMFDLSQTPALDAVCEQALPYHLRCRGDARGDAARRGVGRGVVEPRGALGIHRHLQRSQRPRAPEVPARVRARLWGPFETTSLQQLDAPAATTATAIAASGQGAVRTAISTYHRDSIAGTAHGIATTRHSSADHRPNSEPTHHPTANANPTVSAAVRQARATSEASRPRTMMSTNPWP